MTCALLDPILHGESSRILLTRSTRWSDDHRLKSQDEPASRRHRSNTPAGELGLGLQDNDITAAAWDVPLLSDTNSDSDDATESVATSIDSNDNVYDVYYDVMNMRTLTRDHRESPEASWAVGIEQTIALDAVDSYPLAQSHIPRPCLMYMMYVLECIFF